MIFLYALESYVLYNFTLLDLSQFSELRSVTTRKIEHGIVRKYLILITKRLDIRRQVI